MTLIALYIFFLNHLLSAARSDNVTRPTTGCLTVPAKLEHPEDCMNIIASLNFQPVGDEPRPWGLEGNTSTELPQTVAVYGTCDLLLQRTAAWHSPPPSFALADYDDEFLALYYDCVEGGPRRGGTVGIGPGGGIVATLWTGEFRGVANGTVHDSTNGPAEGLVYGTISSAAVA
ncbi:hypothetical protein N7G274_006936 [Stereocaulon virgatum]|uniref:Ecp2 effector protein domain-containing protein n=1 Tax=Stereocaulon virgatum TaxID=373712 RepID=A0ABR4AAW7_9LECA